MTRRRLAIIRVLVFIACLTPFLSLLAAGAGLGGRTLGANPVQEVLHTLGRTALNILLIGLAITPLRKLYGLNVLPRFRRMLGLFCFFYLCLHIFSYALLDLRLAWGTLWVDVTERPYITVGFLAFVAMIPLAATSTQAMQRRLGKNWRRLHRAVYPIAILGVVHFYWQTKADVSEPLVYGLILTALLGYRLAAWLRRRGGLAPLLAGSRQ